jgi:hypothetical protein
MHYHAERNVPVLIARAVARLGARPMPAGAAALVVDVPGLEDFQSGIPLGGFSQTDRQGGAVNPTGVLRPQPRPADGTLLRVVMLFLINAKPCAQLDAA